MNINRNRRVSSIALLLAGWSKHCAKTGGLIVNSETLEPKDVAACMQAVVDSVRGVAEARGAFKAALEDEQRVYEENADVILAVRQMVMNAFKNKADVLADFGLEKRARKQRTVSEKFETVGKTLATRTARHTMGRKQKEGIRGTPQAPAVPPTPITPPNPITPPVAVVTTPSPIVVPAPITHAAPASAAPAVPPNPIAPVLNGTNGAGSNGATQSGGG